MHVVQDVALSAITIPTSRRVLRSVEGLAASIREIGLLNPVTLAENMTLVAGLHRVEAYRSLGRESIPAVVVKLSTLQARLAELDENLERTELSELERAEQTAERKRVYEAIHPTAPKKAGRPAKNLERSSKFSEAVAGNRHERTVRQEVQIATRIPDDVRDAIRPAAIADKKTELLALSSFDEGTQRQVAEVIKDKPQATLKEAIAEVASNTPKLAEHVATDAEVRWTKNLHTLWVQINGIRDHGGIERLSARWSDAGRRGYVEEIDRMIELLTAIRNTLGRIAA